MRRRRGFSIPSLLAAAVLTPAPAWAVPSFLAKTPLQYLTGAGIRAYPVVRLTWGVIIISVAVIVIIAACVLIAGFRRERPGTAGPDGRMPVERAGSGLAWIYVGTGISTLVLLATSVWTMIALARVAQPPNEPALTIEVHGHQWWWEVLYVGKEPSRIFRTADDIHIPVGVPVRFKLTGDDVIHSFWVPALAGKMDTIPGQMNSMWLEADKPGVYRGQCTEFCGEQHAHMGFTVTADLPDAFEAWWKHQLEPAPQPANDAIATGEAIFITRCGACHAVGGTDAGGRLGPDLSHLMLRKSLAAGTLNNNPVQLSAWIADPQHIKPGAYMPRLDISGTDLAAVRTFLQTLN